MNGKQQCECGERLLPTGQRFDASVPLAWWNDAELHASCERQLAIHSVQVGIAAVRLRAAHREALVDVVDLGRNVVKGLVKDGGALFADVCEVALGLLQFLLRLELLLRALPPCASPLKRNSQIHSP